MQPLLPSYRVSDLERSLEFYSRLGHRCLGSVALDDGSRRAMLLFPEETAVSLGAQSPTVPTVEGATVQARPPDYRREAAR